MAETPSEFVVGANGSVHVAAVGTTAPTNATSSYGAGWVDLGLVSDAGIKPTVNKTVVEIMSWQRRYATARINTKDDFAVAFAMQQWNADTIPFAFGGGAIDTPSAGVFHYSPPNAGVIDYRALGIDWDDGVNNWRLILPKGMVQGPVAFELVRAKGAELPIDFGIAIADGENPWDLYSDAPGWNPS